MIEKFIKFPAVKLLSLVLISSSIGYLIRWNDELFIVITLAVLVVFVISYLLDYKLISYLLGVLVIGFYIAFRIQSNYIETPQKIIPDFPAVIEGEIQKILYTDSTYCRCIIKGKMDAKILPMLKNSSILLSITNPDKRKLNIHSGEIIAVNGIIMMPGINNLPSDFDEKEYMASIGVQWKALANAKNVSILSYAKNFYYLQEYISNKIIEKINILFPETTRGIAIALITGDQSKIQPDIKKKYSYAGTAHVLSVSGLHVAVIASFIYIFLGFIRNRKLKFIIFILFITIFIIFTGIQPAAIRAGLMIAGVAYASILQRKAEILNVVSFIIFWIILFSPELLLSPGFRMSCGAILGIIFFYNPIKALLNNFFNRLKILKNISLSHIINSISLTISASIIVTPIVAYYFGIFSIISPVANLFVVPFMSLGLVYGIISVMLSFISIHFSIYFAAAADFLIRLTDSIQDIALSLPNSYLESYSLFYSSILASVIIIYLLFSRNRKRFIFRLAAGILVIILIMLTFYSFSDNKIKILPRKQFEAAIIPFSDNSQFVLLNDCEPHGLPRRDLSLEKYLTMTNSNLIIGVTGNSGINLTDEVKKLRKIAILELNDSNKSKILKMINK